MKTTHSIASILLITALVVSGYSCKPVAPASLPSLNISTNQTVTAVPQNPTANQTVSNSTGTSTITVRVSPLEGGKVSPSSGNYSNGTDVTFTATPAASYVFSSWWFEHTDSGITSMGRIGSNLTLNFDVETPGALTAYFVALPTAPNTSANNPNPDIVLPPKDIKYKLRVFADPPGAGSVSSVNGSYAAGTSVTINATPADGFKVLEWNIYDNGGTGGVPANTSYTTGMDSDKVIIVSFTSVNNTNPVRSTPPQLSTQPSYPLEVIVDPPWAGSVSPSSGVYDAGTTVTLVATPASGYVSSWNNNAINVTVNSITVVRIYFVASPSIWTVASLYQTGQRIAPGDYFYISADYTSGQFGPDSVQATFDQSLVALIDRKDAGFAGPITPGMHAASVWLLFKALKPGTAQISVAQVRNGYSSPATIYSVTIGN